MSLDFLTPRASSERPSRSPLLDAALASGGSAAVRDGWEVADSFGALAAEQAACLESVGFADLSPLAKFELQYPRGGAGREFEPGLAERLSDGWRCPVRPDRELLLADPAQAVATRAELDPSARVCDLTASLAAVAVAGPLARETFARFCALDLRPASLPVHGFRPGSVARTPGFVLREGTDRYLALFGAAYAEYLWEVLADAAGALGGRPVGSAALPAVTEREALDA